MQIEGQTDRLMIEALSVDHADELVGLLDPLVNSHFVPDDSPRDIEDLRRHFTSMVSYHAPPGAQFLNFAVRSTTACIGRLEAFVRDKDAELAFLFVANAWGQGYAAEALRWLQKYLVDNFGVLRFWVCITPSNQASLKLASRLGFEWVERDAWPQLGSYDDGDVVLSLTFEEERSQV